MLTRLFLGLSLAVIACAAAATESDAARPGIVANARNAADAAPARRATQADVNRLRRLNTKLSVKCARIEYIHQCLSTQNMTLKRTPCRAGSTEASCCKAARDYVMGKICGPLWDRLKKAGQHYFPGVWLCKCIEQPGAM